MRRWLRYARAAAPAVAPRVFACLRPSAICGRRAGAGRRHAPLAVGQALLRLGGVEPLAAHQRPGETVGVVDVVVAVAALDAQRHAVDRRVGRAGHAHDLAVAHVQVEVAADAAVGAGRAHLRHLAGAARAHAHLVVERADRAVGHALAAAFAARVEQSLIGARPPACS